MITDTQRHANKIRKFEAAVERAGIDRVSDVIGRGAFSSFECARDAQVRRQSPVIIASFLSEAEKRCEDFCGLQAPDEDTYGVLWSIK